MTTSAIIGCGSYLPLHILSNSDLSKMVDTNDEWIFSRTGIKNRHIAAPDELTSDMATKALEKALQMAGCQVSSLDAIIVATTTPDLIFPATAVKVQQNIGMNHGFAFDLQAVCSGFVYGLSVAHSLIVAGQANRIALIGADTMSRIVDWQDRGTCVLFGDGAGAIILEATKNTQNGILGIKLLSEPELFNILKVEGGIARGNLEAKLIMNGKEVFKHAVQKMSIMTEELLQYHNLNVNDIDWLIPHQANARIISSVAQRLNIPESRVAFSLKDHANTSAASIPLALDKYIKEGLIKTGQLIAMASAGGGMTFGSALLKI